ALIEVFAQTQQQGTDGPSFVPQGYRHAVERINFAGANASNFAGFNRVIANSNQLAPNGVAAGFEGAAGTCAQPGAGHQLAIIVRLKDDRLVERQNCLQQLQTAGEPVLGETRFQLVGSGLRLIHVMSEYGVDLPEAMQLHQKNRGDGSERHGRKQNIELQVSRNKQAGRRHHQKAQPENQERTAG